MALPEPVIERTAAFGRLLEGMARAVADKGYADTTIADIVREAGVSRRTFYENFTTKAECFIALYEAASRNALAVLQAAIDPAQKWEAQVEQAVAAYLANMAQNPVLMRSLFIEIVGLGPDGLAARRRVNQEIAGFMLEVVNGGPGGDERRKPLTRQMATAVVGGMNELVLQAIEEDAVGRLAELARPAGDLVRAVARA